MSTTLWEGWLLKEGGRGHGRRRAQMRYCLLKAPGFLFYFHHPSPSLHPLPAAAQGAWEANGSESEKPIEALMGVLNLSQCEFLERPRDGGEATKDSPDAFAVASALKDYNFSLSAGAYGTYQAVIGGMERIEVGSYLALWRSHLRRTIAGASANPAAFAPYQGWLHKRGGAKHKHKNWKKRHVVLRGNLLAYFNEPKKSEDDVSGLKGWLELSLLSGARRGAKGEEALLSPGFPHFFLLQDQDGKEFIFASAEEKEIDGWWQAIQSAIRSSAQSIGVPIWSEYKEEISKTGSFEQLLPHGRSVGRWCALTNLHLRLYRQGEQMAAAVEKNWTNQLLLSIPLTSLSVVARGVGAMFGLVCNAGGYEFVLTGRQSVCREWAEQILHRLRLLAGQILKRGHHLRFQCLPLPPPANGECVVLRASEAGLRVEFVASPEKRVEVVWKQLVSTDSPDDETVKIKYRARKSDRSLKASSDSDKEKAKERSLKGSSDSDKEKAKEVEKESGKASAGGVSRAVSTQSLTLACLNAPGAAAVLEAVMDFARAQLSKSGASGSVGGTSLSASASGDSPPPNPRRKKRSNVSNSSNSNSADSHKPE